MIERGRKMRLKDIKTVAFMDCFAALAMTDSVVIANTKATNHRHWLRRTCVCEERSDEAIHKKMSLLDCFAPLAMTDSVVIANTKATNHRHWLRRTCVYEEHSDEAIHKKMSLLDCFASLAMTDSVVFVHNDGRHCVDIRNDDNSDDRKSRRDDISVENTFPSSIKSRRDDISNELKIEND
jgi:hypothetical protein